MREICNEVYKELKIKPSRHYHSNNIKFNTNQDRNEIIKIKGTFMRNNVNKGSLISIHVIRSINFIFFF